MIGSTELVIAFTSYGGHSVPAGNFEWQNIVGEFATHKIFMRDSFQHWYHSACLGFSPSLTHTIASIKAYVATHGITKIITIGSSMGGHGALLYACLLQADHCLSIAPQINIHSDFLLPNQDLRWEAKMTEINMIGYDDLDLSDLVRRSPPGEALIYYHSAHSLDETHAKTLTGLRNIVVQDVGIGEHEVAYALAKQGTITRILRDRLSAASFVNNENNDLKAQSVMDKQKTDLCPKSKG